MALLLMIHFESVTSENMGIAVGISLLGGPHAEIHMEVVLLPWVSRVKVNLGYMRDNNEPVWPFEILTLLTTADW